MNYLFAAQCIRKHCSCGDNRNIFAKNFARMFVCRKCDIEARVGRNILFIHERTANGSIKPITMYQITMYQMPFHVFKHGAGK